MQVFIYNFYMKRLGNAIWYTLGIAFLVIIGYLFYMMHEAGYSVTLVVLVALYSTSAFFNLILFSQTRHSGAKLSWIIVMTLLPIFGHIIFVIFGQRYSKRKSLEEYRKKDTFKYEEKGVEGLDIQKRQSSISKRGIYPADITLHRTGAEGFKALFEDLESAKEFIHIQYYIIKPGEIYEQLKQILIKKVKEGVEVRFIVDDFGRWGMPWYEIKDLRDKGIKIGIYGKVHFPFIGSENGYRTHRKLAIVDGVTVHTGGINIADEYAHLNKKYGLWIDYQVTITGKAVRSFSLLFIDDWKMVTGISLDIKKYLKEKDGGKSRSVLVEDSPEIVDPILQDSLVTWILNAEKSIKLTTPYFIPTEEVIGALRTASLSGVDITIYVPGKPDKKLVLISSMYNAERLTKYGIKFKVAKDMLIHSKLGLFDDKYAYFGTANIDNRSLYSNFETVNLVSGPIVKDIKKLMIEYDEMSNIKKFNKTPRIKERFLRVFVRIFSPLM